MNSDGEGSDRPPLFKTWRSWYLLVIIELGGMILLLTLFSRWFE